MWLFVCLKLDSLSQSFLEFSWAQVEQLLFGSDAGMEFKAGAEDWGHSLESSH